MPEALLQGTLTYTNTAFPGGKFKTQYVQATLVDDSSSAGTAEYNVRVRTVGPLMGSALPVSIIVLSYDSAQFQAGARELTVNGVTSYYGSALRKEAWALDPSSNAAALSQREYTFIPYALVRSPPTASTFSRTCESLSRATHEFSLVQMDIGCKPVPVDTGYPRLLFRNEAGVGPGAGAQHDAEGGTTILALVKLTSAADEPVPWAAVLADEFDAKNAAAGGTLTWGDVAPEVFSGGGDWCWLKTGTLVESGAGLTAFK